MVTLTLWNFAKDTNSTKRPTIQNAVQLFSDLVEIFEPCSFHDPAFILNGAVGYAAYSSSNYAYVTEWNAYYWVGERTFSGGQIIVSCELDPLATYKAAINASSQFVLRSASTANKHIVDTMYPAVEQAKLLRNVLVTEADGNPYVSNINNGVFILGITSNAATSGSSMGTNLYVSMTPAEMYSFTQAMLGNDAWMGVGSQGFELSADLAKMILNPLQYIQSCKFFPFKPNTNIFRKTQLSSIPFGWWSITANCYTAFDGTDQTVTKSFNINIPKHPQAATYGQYLNYSPFSEYKLVLPVVGKIDLPSRVGMMDRIQVTMNIDIPTGQAMYRVYSDNDSPAMNFFEMSFAADVAVDIPIAQITRDVISATKGAISTVAEASSAIGVSTIIEPGKAIAAAANSINSAIDTAISAVKPIPAFMGSAGCIAQYKAIYPAVENNYHETATPNNSHFGSPLCATKTLSTLSGITVCSSPHIDIPGAAKQDVEYIESVMATGIRLE